jgi:AraC-type DNA-binding domain-containing proteins
MDDINFPIIGAESRLPVYLVGIGSHTGQNLIERPSGFPYFQFIYSTGGSGLLHVNGGVYPVGKRQGFFLYPNERHEYRAVGEPWGTNWFCFDGGGAAALAAALGFTSSRSFYLGDYASVDQLWRQLLIEAKSGNLERGYRSSAILYNLLILLKSLVREEPPSSGESGLAQLYAAIGFIEAHYSSAIGLAELAAQAAVSPQYLCRLFKQQMNMRPFEYLTKRRLQAGKKLLLENGLTEAEIAEQCGFNSFSYFCAVFKRYEKMTPKEFRGYHGR